MREIKFRAWDKDNFEMFTYDNIGDVIFGLENDGTVSLFICDSGETPNVEIMQFTGLLDRDGIEICEGDIAVWYVNDVQRIGEIFYTGQAFDMQNNASGYGYIGWDALRGEMEIIGNIHENPELLEAKS